MLGIQIEVDFERQTLGPGEALYRLSERGYETRDFLYRVQVAGLAVGEMIPHRIGQGGEYGGRASQSMTLA